MATVKNADEAYLKIVVPKTIKHKFKMLCWGEGKTMTNRLVQLISEEVIRCQDILEDATQLQEFIGKKSK